MAYQDDFRNKVLAALKAKNLAVDISQEATQQAIVEEAQIVAKSEPTAMSSEDMTQVLQDIAKQLAQETGQVFNAQSADFTAFKDQIAGGGPGGVLGGSYSGGGIAQSTGNKDIMIIPAAGALGAAGLATSVNSLSQIDFKFIANPNAYQQFDPFEVKSSIFNWAERITGNTFDTPVLGIGGAWGGVSYAPTSSWGVQTSGVGGSQGSGVGGSINFDRGFGQIIFLKPATSTIYASLYNDIGLDTSASSGLISITGYQPAVPGSFPTVGIAVTFGGIGGSGNLSIQGAALRSQGNTARFASSLTIANSTVTDTIVLGLSGPTGGVGGTVSFVGNGTSQQYVLSTVSSSFATGDLFYASGTGHTALIRLPVGANNTFLTSNGTNPSWTNTIAANTVAVNAAIGSTILYPLLNNAAGSGSAVSTDIDFNVDPGANILRYATGSFYVGTAISSPIHTSVADVDVRPGANSTTGIQLANLAGQPVLNVDTSNSRVSIGSNVAAPTYTLDVSGDTNISSGSVYRINGTSVLSSNTLGTGVVNSSLTSVGTISTGVWSATAITSFYGGTGFQTYTTGDLLVGAGATIVKYAIGTINQVLLSNGTTAVWSAATGLTVGTSNQITIAQTNVATSLYPLFANATTGSIGASIDLDIVYNAAGNVLTVPSVYSGTALSSPLFTSNASVAIRPGTNATTAITLQNAGGANILTVDTVSGYVGINKTPSLFALDVQGSANLTTGNAYNINGASVLNANTLGSSVVTSSLTTVGIIGTGVWQGTAVGTTYGGTGSNLSPTSSIGNSNRILVTGNTGQYPVALIDNATSGNLLVSGGANAAPTFTNTTAAAFTFSNGALTINNAVITQGTVSNTPTNANDLVNKSYADSLAGGLDPHASVRLTTLSAIGGSYRQAGTAGTLSGFGDYIIATTPAELIGAATGFDTPTSGIALTNGQRVLVKDGVTGGYASGTGAFGAFPTTFGGFAASWVANGIYTVTSYGGSATSGWLLIRATDTDNQNAVQELTGGTFTFVEEGTNFADNGFVCTNDTTILGPIGFGSTQIAWSAFSGGAALINGQGISKTGNTIATNFNFTNDGNLVGGITYQGFAIGGARSGGVGFSSRTTFTVTAASGADAVATSVLTLNTTGFKLAGGATNRALTVAGSGDQTVTFTADGFSHAGGKTLTFGGTQDLLLSSTGAGVGLTVASNSTVDFRTNTLSIVLGTGNITLQSGSASGNTASTVQVLVQNGQAQYQLSTANATMALGDLYYGGQSSVGWTSMARLTLGGTGASVLIRNATVPVWGTINLASSDYVSGVLGISNGGTNNGSLSVTGGQVVYTDGSKLASTAQGTAGNVLISAGASAPSFSAITLSNSNSVTGQLTLTNGGTGANLSAVNGGVVYSTSSALAISAAGSAGQALISNGAAAPTFGTLTLAGGGTSNTASGASVSYQLAAYNSVGSGISGIAQPTASNSVLIQSAANNVPTWSNGPLAIAYGGSNATASNFTANGVVIYDSANTRLTSATGLTMTAGFGLSVTGTVAASGGFFVGTNSVVTSVTPVGSAAIYGGVGISVLNTNPAGALTISGFGQTVVINGPGTGITGTGAATQVAYYNATRELTGSTFLTYSPTAATGVGLSVGVNATSGTIMQVSSNQTMTSGLLLDVDNLSAQRFTIDFKGMTSITTGSGNTALVLTGGRTLLSAPNTNYASINFGNTNANPGAGITQIGDLWFNGTNLYFRKDATTSFDLLVGSVSGSGTVNRITKWATSSSLTDSNITDAGVGMTITSTSSVGAGGGSTAVLTLQTLSADNSLTDRYFLRGVTSAGARLFSIDTAGNLRATTKSFDIPHPTKEGLRLVYGVLEGPEHGVYHRGTIEGKGVIQVNLPEYWHKLVGDQYTVQLTPWGNYNVGIGVKTENYFTIQLVGDPISRKFKNIKVDYIVHGSRLDAPLDTEQ